MKKLAVLTILACLAVVTTSQAVECTTIDFESIDTRTSVVGPYAISSLLSIDGLNMEVVEEGADVEPGNISIISYNSNLNGIPNNWQAGGYNWLPDDNEKSFGNLSSERGLQSQDLTITFNPDIVVTSFSIDLFDYGDWFPAQGNTGTGNPILRAFDASSVEINSDSATVSYGSGNDVWNLLQTNGTGSINLSVSGSDIAYVTLTFDRMDPGMTFDNLEICHEPREIEVDIDIKPGSWPNSFNINGNGVIPVAILGSADFDVTCIDPSTLTLAGLAVSVRGKDKLMVAYEDVSGDFTYPEGAPDGYMDLVVKFEDDVAAWEPGEDMAELIGNLTEECGGTPISGWDYINVVQ